MFSTVLETDLNLTKSCWCRVREETVQWRTNGLDTRVHLHGLIFAGKDFLIIVGVLTFSCHCRRHYGDEVLWAGRSAAGRWSWSSSRRKSGSASAGSAAAAPIPTRWWRQPPLWERATPSALPPPQSPVQCRKFCFLHLPFFLHNVFMSGRKSVRSGSEQSWTDGPHQLGRSWWKNRGVSWTVELTLALASRVASASAAIALCSCCGSLTSFLCTKMIICQA